MAAFWLVWGKAFTLATTRKTKAAGEGRFNKQDWINAAVQILVAESIDHVKVHVLAKKLGVSRSSFYWQFATIQDLHTELIDYWLEQNTGPIIERATRPAPTITKSICNLFECWVDRDLFDPQLDIAIRFWGRLDPAISAVVDQADNQRIDALTRMFVRYDYQPEEAFTRARVLYFTQIGHYTLGLRESEEARLSHLHSYLITFTGREPAAGEIEMFSKFVRKWLEKQSKAA
ncbi:TetR family transcriptional regulator [Rhizobium leguminosarum bv. viciae]|nr:TetR family transcriptional regulator [Rhizobium leguminosarum bv. viciae]NKL56766.1 TetR family transcriptional regulator [Rhizobium leguminosarum bv. viciae]